MPKVKTSDSSFAKSKSNQPSSLSFEISLIGFVSSLSRSSPSLFFCFILIPAAISILYYSVL